MLKNQTINLNIVERIAKQLGDLNDHVVYVGGAIVSLYVTDEAVEQPRPTTDIDISVQISTYAEMDQLRELLASKGIYPAQNETVMYRYQFDEILIDFIPYEATPLGPTNSLLKPRFKVAEIVKIGEVTIKILPVCFFIASKWEAFKSRCNNDPRFSHDFEDIIYVIDNNLDVVTDFKNSEQSVEAYLGIMSREILKHEYGDEIIECHLNPHTLKSRKEIVVDKLKQFIE